MLKVGDIVNHAWVPEARNGIIISIDGTKKFAITQWSDKRIYKNPCTDPIRNLIPVASANKNETLFKYGEVIIRRGRKENWGIIFDRIIQEAFE